MYSVNSNIMACWPSAVMSNLRIQNCLMFNYVGVTRPKSYLIFKQVYFNNTSLNSQEKNKQVCSACVIGLIALVEVDSIELCAVGLYNWNSAQASIHAASVSG